MIKAIAAAAIPDFFDNELAAAVPIVDAVETEFWAALHPPPCIRDASCFATAPV
jgi:hypothetical protein